MITSVMMIQQVMYSQQPVASPWGRSHTKSIVFDWENKHELVIFRQLKFGGVHGTAKIPQFPGNGHAFSFDFAGKGHTYLWFSVLQLGEEYQVLGNYWNLHFQLTL